jgi:threonine/homoserine/homoserine lactone efflux protein
MSDPLPRGTLTGGTTATGFAVRLRRAWSTERGRRRIVVTVGLVVVVVVIVVVASLFSSLAGQSQSYRDGYSAGGSAYTAYGETTNTSAEQSCQNEAVGPNGVPHLDNRAEWIQGCVDGFNTAQSGN